MRVNRMRIRFEDPRLPVAEAEAIARRISELVTDAHATGAGPHEELARHVAGAIADALRAAGARA